MDTHSRQSEFPSLEERVRAADAEQSIAVGYAIGDALAALWRVISSFSFSPSASTGRKRAELG